ncbi:MAG: menaquinol oxidoreductase, partial [Deltaproteobacteria bacterium RBG_19FT_COMBO_52_11]
MYDGKKIITGLVIFLGLMTFPFWYSRGKVIPPPELKLDTPAIQQLAEKRCVEDTPYMRASHMALLDSWRDSAVREGHQVYAASDGKKYSMSLSNTCLGCHSNKEKFCDQC